jgi:hypothetical protein
LDFEGTKVKNTERRDVNRRMGLFGMGKSGEFRL